MWHASVVVAPDPETFARALQDFLNTQSPAIYKPIILTNVVLEPSSIPDYPPYVTYSATVVWWTSK